MVRFVSISCNGLVLAAKARVCDTFASRFLGLMFSRPLGEKEGLLIDVGVESRELSSIHMLFVFFSIDVLWLDSQMRVVGIRRVVRPFCPLAFSKAPARYVVELPKYSTLAVRDGDVMVFGKI